MRNINQLALFRFKSTLVLGSLLLSACGGTPKPTVSSDPDHVYVATNLDLIGEGIHPVTKYSDSTEGNIFVDGNGVPTVECFDIKEPLKYMPIEGDILSEPDANDVGRIDSLVNQVSAGQVCDSIAAMLTETSEQP